MLIKFDNVDINFNEIIVDEIFEITFIKNEF